MRNEKINSFWQAVIIGLGTVAAEQLKEGERGDECMCVCVSMLCVSRTARFVYIHRDETVMGGERQ